MSLQSDHTMVECKDDDTMSNDRRNDELSEDDSDVENSETKGGKQHSKSRRRTRTFSLEESEGYTNTSKAFLLEDLVSYYPYPTLTAALRVKKGLPSIRSEPWCSDPARRNLGVESLDLNKLDKKMKGGGGSHVLVVTRPENESEY